MLLAPTFTLDYPLAILASLGVGLVLVLILAGAV